MDAVVSFIDHRLVIRTADGGERTLRFWPGSGPVLEPAFYAYAVPESAGFKAARCGRTPAFYHRELNEFLLPYEAVRTAHSPEAAIRAFLESTYENGANLAGWDRAALERRPAGPSEK